MPTKQDFSTKQRHRFLTLKKTSNGEITKVFDLKKHYKAGGFMPDFSDEYKRIYWKLSKLNFKKSEMKYFQNKINSEIDIFIKFNPEKAHSNFKQLQKIEKENTIVQQFIESY